MRITNSSETRKHFSAILKLVERGNSYEFHRGTSTFRIIRVPDAKPIPIAPAGYFNDCRTGEEIKELNKRALQSKRKCYP